jgi:hypothetical protein
MKLLVNDLEKLIKNTNNLRNIVLVCDNEDKIK